MTPEERAFEVLYREFSGGNSRETFRVMLADEEGGRYMRRFRDAIAIGIKEDRKAIASANAPS